MSRRLCWNRRSNRIKWYRSLTKLCRKRIKGVSRSRQRVAIYLAFKMVISVLSWMNKMIASWWLQRRRKNKSQKCRSFCKRGSSIKWRRMTISSQILWGIRKTRWSKNNNQNLLLTPPRNKSLRSKTTWNFKWWTLNTRGSSDSNSSTNTS